ncbi:MAG: MFS transporter [Chloroflexota bacterium]|jgi:MFS family permease|nr:MFS transporter [Chloroflexota bacterium]MDP6756775.1 MFS transporter [Chloroflexota bacterium]
MGRSLRRSFPTDNVGRYYLFSFIFGAAINAIVSVLVLFWLDRGLSLGQVMILMSTYGVSLLIFEIPTGVLADRFSRKWSLAIGALIQTAVGAIILSTSFYPVLLGAYVLVGVGVAFLSGTGEALIFDLLKQEGREGEVQRVFGAGLSWFHIGGVTGAVSAGLLVTRFELSAAVWAYTLLFLAAAGVALWLDEPEMLTDRRKTARSRSFRSQSAGLLTDTRSSFGIVIRSRSVKALIAVGLTLSIVSSLAEIPFSQPFLVEFGLRPEHVAYVWASFSAAAAVVAALSARLSRLLHGDERRFILVMTSLMVVGLIAMVNAPGAGVAIASLVLMFVIAAGLAPPFLNAGINRRIPSEHRASILSIWSMAFGMVSSFAGPFFGFLSDGYSLQTSLLVFEFTFLPLLLLIAVLPARALNGLTDRGK